MQYPGKKKEVRKRNRQEKNQNQTAKRLTKAVKHTPIGKTGTQAICSPCQACGLDHQEERRKLNSDHNE